MDFSLHWASCCRRTQASVVAACRFSSWAHWLWSTDSVVVAHELRYSMARGIFLDQGLNLRLLRWQSDSLPLSHQGSPHCGFNFHLPDDESADHLFHFILLGDVFVQITFKKRIRRWAFCLY